MNKYLLFGGGALALYLLTRQQATGAGPTAPSLSGTPADSAAARQAIRDTVERSGVSTTYIYSDQQPVVWNYYARQALGWNPPEPPVLFGLTDAHKPVDFENWWKKVEPHLPPSNPVGAQQQGVFA